MTELLLLICIIQAIYIAWIYLNLPEISVKTGLEKMKDSLIGMIVFFQSNYQADDQIVLIKKWLDSVDFKKVSKEQMRLFKDYVDGL